MGLVKGMEINGRASEMLGVTTQEFLLALERRFGDRRKALLERRKQRAGFDFLSETASVRAGEWRIDPVPDVLADRRVEITGPCDAKMIINALNSGANVFMADCEDSQSPSWENQIGGQESLFRAVRRSLTFTSPEGKAYALNDKTATLFVRPRGWHLDEAHVTVDGKAISGSLFDFGVFFFNNAREQLNRGAGPFFYLPKLESHLEARLWNDVFDFAQDTLGIKRGTIKATVLIETLPAAFEMDEILHELRTHSAGLNCGRWGLHLQLHQEAARSSAPRSQPAHDGQGVPACLRAEADPDLSTAVVRTRWAAWLRRSRSKTTRSERGRDGPRARRQRA